MSKRLMTEEVNKLLALRGIQLVGEWKGNRVQHTFQCINGHSWNTGGLGPVKKGHGCPSCAASRLRLSREVVNQYLIGRGITLVGDWNGLSNINRFKCEQGHEWEVTGSAPVKSGSGCPECHYSSVRLSSTEVNQRLSSRGITLVGEWINSEVSHTFICQAGHTWTTKAKNVLHRGTGCMDCRSERFRLTKDEVNVRIKDRGLTLISEWFGTVKDNRFRCELGHEWWGSTTSILYSHKGCPECSRLKRQNRRKFACTAV